MISFVFSSSPTTVPERIPIRDDDNDYDDADDIHGPRNRSSLTPHHSDPEEHDDTLNWLFHYISTAMG